MASCHAGGVGTRALTILIQSLLPFLSNSSTPHPTCYRPSPYTLLPHHFSSLLLTYLNSYSYVSSRLWVDVKPSMTVEVTDYYLTRPAPSLSRRATLSSIHELDADSVPEGTVASRVQRLQQLANPDLNLTLLPFSERDRDSESSGWGRRLEGEVRSVQPASHSKSVEVNHSVPRRVASSYLRRPSALPAIPEKDALHSVRPSRSVLVRQTPPDMESNSSADSPPSTPSSRREDARQILMEYKISFPSG
ncbi:hypothetical protein GE09DRAFT_121032 [Coniochaeta sp. 2T2.1]|nr:hypothetical protein GE09DRAFT_121032 [Coniochaeta sp. 2T2.1]